MVRSICSELGCYNHLDDVDRSRYPRSLSITVNVELRQVQKISMRSRCSSCYGTRYRGKYSAISYKWSHEERRHGVPVSLCSEAGKNLGPGWIPTLSRPLVDVTLATGMFFLDTLNTKRGERADWTLGNVYSTYSNCKNVLCFENPSDRRINGEPLHLGGDRHRGASLQSKYCRTERWIANSKNIPLIFYNGSGGTTTNLDRLGSRDGSNPDGTYQHRTLVTRGNTTFLTPDMTEEQRRKRMGILESNSIMMGDHLEQLLSGAGLFGYSNSSMGTPNSTFLQPPTLGLYTDPLGSMLSGISIRSLSADSLGQLPRPDTLYTGNYGLTQNLPRPNTLYTGNCGLGQNLPGPDTIFGPHTLYTGNYGSTPLLSSSSYASPLQSYPGTEGDPDALY